MVWYQTFYQRHCIKTTYNGINQLGITISLSCHEQVCLMSLHFAKYWRYWRSISQNWASLNIFVHDVLDLLYYEHWTDKRKHFYVNHLDTFQKHEIFYEKYQKYWQFR